MIERRFGFELSSHELPAPMRAPWERRMRAELSRIAQARSGRLVLDTLRWFIKDGRATLKLWPWRSGRQNANTSSWPEERPIAVHIQYSAEVWSPAEADEMLLHELAHALRHAAGKHRKCERNGVCRMTGALASFKDREEFFAVLVENVYRSDQSRDGGRIHLRKSHADTGPMQPELADSFRFFTAGHRVYQMIAGYAEEHPVFTRHLAAVPARFNPFAAYFRDPGRAMRLSLGSVADAAAYEEELFDTLQGNRTLHQLSVQSRIGSSGSTR